MRRPLAVLAICGMAACAPDPEPVRKAAAPAPKAVQPQPVLFNTPEADEILSKLQVFPKDNPWNEDISDRPVPPDSDKIVDVVGRTLRFR